MSEQLLPEIIGEGPYVTVVPVTLEESLLPIAPAKLKFKLSWMVTKIVTISETVSLSEFSARKIILRMLNCQ